MVVTTGRHCVPLTVHIGATGNAQSVQWAVLYAVSPLQTVFQSSDTDEPCRPLPGLAEVSQVEAISNAVMAQMSGMMAVFQAQMSAAKVNSGSSTLPPPASSSVAEDIFVRPEVVRPVASSMVTGPHGQPTGVRLVLSSIEAMASTVRHQPTGTESNDEGAPRGEYFSSSSPESACMRSGPVSTVTQVPLGAKVDSARMVT